MRILLTLLVITLLSCQDNKNVIDTNNTLGYTITGNTKQSGGYAYLQKYNADNVMTTIDSAAIDSETFVLEGHVTNLEPYQLVVNQEVYPIILENTKYELKETGFTGTKLQDDYIVYYEGLRSTENAFVYQRNFITSHPESILSVIVLKTMLGKTKWRINQNRLAFNALDEAVKDSYLAKEINIFITDQESINTDTKTVEAIPVPKETPKETKITPKKKQVTTAKKKTNKVVKPVKPTYVGINFEADDIDGNNFVLSSITSKSNYVLIDFWASWCKPCREQNPYLVEVYNLYHSKGFDIVSVSEDRSRSAWKNAIIQDGLPWHHVIDDFNRLTKLYNIESIPHTILINSTGEIIASDVSPYILKTKLAGLLRN